MNIFLTLATVLMLGDLSFAENTRDELVGSPLIVHRFFKVDLSQIKAQCGRKLTFGYECPVKVLQRDDIEFSLMNANALIPIHSVELKNGKHVRFSLYPDGYSVASLPGRSVEEREYNLSEAIKQLPNAELETTLLTYRK